MSRVDDLTAENADLRAENDTLRAALAQAVPVAPAPIPYPAMRYHTSGTICTVADEAADKALGAGWSAIPAETAPVTYPGWRYHVAKDPVLVKDAAADAALGAGWYPSVVAAAQSAS